jgi:hypothetical protein
MAEKRHCLHIGAKGPQQTDLVGASKLRMPLASTVALPHSGLPVDVTGGSLFSAAATRIADKAPQASRKQAMDLQAGHLVALRRRKTERR